MPEVRPRKPRPGASTCVRCGIVFEKYYKYHPRPGDVPAPALPVPRPRHSSPPREGLWELILPSDPKGDWVTLGAQSPGAAGPVLWGFNLMAASVASGAAGQSFLHNANLPFHEAGHILFRPFGPYMASLGGTLGQLLMPAICTGVLLVQTRDPFGAVGGALVVRSELPRHRPLHQRCRCRGPAPGWAATSATRPPTASTTGITSSTEIGLLHLDRSLARGSHFVGSLIMLLALAWGATVLWGQYRAARLHGPV